MQEHAIKLIQTFPDQPHLIIFAQRLLPWLLMTPHAIASRA
jgi:hypothetical protein